MLWLDTYYQWLSPNSKCCGISDTNKLCNASDPDDKSCHTCILPGEKNPEWRNLSRPNSTEFERYLQPFLEDNPGPSCPFGGHAGFSSAVKLNPDNKTIKSKTMIILCLPVDLTLCLPFSLSSIVCDDLSHYPLYI